MKSNREILGAIEMELLKRPLNEREMELRALDLQRREREKIVRDINRYFLASEHISRVKFRLGGHSLIHIE